MLSVFYLGVFEGFFGQHRVHSGFILEPSEGHGRSFNDRPWIINSLFMIFVGFICRRLTVAYLSTEVIQGLSIIHHL